MQTLRKLGRRDMVALADALASERLSPPFRPRHLEGYVPRASRDEITEALSDLHAAGMTPRALAATLRLLAEERAASQSISDRLDLVWSGIEGPGAMSRDTTVVVKKLLREAERRVLISSYAIDQGEWVRVLLGELAARMEAEPRLAVHLFLNIRRAYKDERPEAELLRAFSETFRKEVWPGSRLPEVFYDPRSLKIGGATRACLHAKCIVVDESRSLVTSANVTEAAHERNIEAGVLVASSLLARSLWRQFESLVEDGTLKPLAL